jgi:type I restriction enzyme R subunit
MSKQPEQTLENNLITQLAGIGYEKVIINDENDLLNNFKSQLEKHNKIELSERVWEGAKPFE